MTNRAIAELLRKVAAAYQILGENRFRIIAYERAADSIEHLTSEAKDVWQSGKIDEVPGIGSTIAKHLDELLRTGTAKHFDSVMAKVPEAVFPLLGVPGIGSKRAYRLVTELGLTRAATAVADLKKAAIGHRIAPLDGFGEKSEHDIIVSIEQFERGAVKEQRIILSEADAIAGDIIAYLKSLPGVSGAEVLGSLRRKAATIGDIDIAVRTTDPAGAIAHFCAYPHEKLIERGEAGASILTRSGRQVDMRVIGKESYGAMLQYFTGSKNHNIALRTYALGKGMSLSEYGIKVTGGTHPHAKAGGIYNAKKGLYEFATEEDFYRFIGMPWIPPEMREGSGEIDAALAGTLPEPVGYGDLKGDVHIHTEYDLEPSHDLGAHSLEACLDKAAALGYEYLGVSDHNPSIGHHTEKQIIDIMKRRKEYYEHHLYTWQSSTKSRVHLFIMLEVDINPAGALALPDKAFDSVDAVIASIHSSFGLDKEAMTKRMLTAIRSHPKVRVIGHPTGRLLTRREGYELAWDEVFAECVKRDIAIEINASPYRLDLPDLLVREAVDAGVRLAVNTDAHSVPEMEFAKYGLAVARRGWARKRDIVNCLGYNDFRRWLMP